MYGDFFLWNNVVAVFVLRCLALSYYIQASREHIQSHFLEQFARIGINVSRIHNEQIVALFRLKIERNGWMGQLEKSAKMFLISAGQMDQTVLLLTNWLLLLGFCFSFGYLFLLPYCLLLFFGDKLFSIMYL